MPAANDAPSARDLDALHRLISSARVEGTPVVNRDGERMGVIHSIMIDKQSGKAAYAVMSFGGFLGIGARVHPIPWDKLTYSNVYGGYCVVMSREDLEHAPSLHLDEADRPAERHDDERLLAYYSATQYWGM